MPWRHRFQRAPVPCGERRSAGPTLTSRGRMIISAQARAVCGPLSRVWRKGGDRLRRIEQTWWRTPVVALSPTRPAGTSASAGGSRTASTPPLGTNIRALLVRPSDGAARPAVRSRVREPRARRARGPTAPRARRPRPGRAAIGPNRDPTSRICAAKSPPLSGGSSAPQPCKLLLCGPGLRYVPTESRRSGALLAARDNPAPSVGGRPPRALGTTAPPPHARADNGNSPTAATAA